MGKFSNTKLEMIKTVMAFPDNAFITSAMIRERLPHLTSQVIWNQMNALCETGAVMKVSQGQYCVSDKDKMMELFDVELKSDKKTRPLKPTKVIPDPETLRLNKRLNQIDALYSINSTLGPRLRTFLLNQVDDAITELSHAKRRLIGKHTIPHDLAVLYLQGLDDEIDLATGDYFLMPFTKEQFPDTWEEHIKLIHDFIKKGVA